MVTEKSPLLAFTVASVTRQNFVKKVCFLSHPRLPRGDCKLLSKGYTIQRIRFFLRACANGLFVISR